MKHLAGKLIYNMSIRKRIIIVLVLLVVFFMAGVAVTRVHQLHQQTSAMIGERLQNHANMAVGVFVTINIFTDWILNAIANMPYVRHALTNAGSAVYADLAGNLSAFSSSMNLMRYDTPAVYAHANMFVFDADFRLIAKSYPDGDTVDLSYAAFYENRFMALNGKPFVSPVVKNPRSGLWQFFFSRPVMIDDTFSGLVAVLTNADILYSFLRAPTHDYDSFINIADNAGTIFFSNRPVYMGRHIDDLGVYQALGYVPFDRLFNHNSAITGIDKIAYIVSEPLLGWTIVSFFDAHAIDSIPWTIFLLMYPTIIGVLLAAILITVIIHRSLIPLKDLADTAKDVARGNLDVSFNICRNDEIAQVSQSFLEIVTALNLLQDNFRKAESAITSSDTIYMLEDSRLSGVYDEMLTRTNNVIKHIQRSKLEAENASKAKSDFLSRMSHEIRTPMNAIMGMTDLILRENIPAAAQDQAVTIKQSGYHLLSIINDILDLSKVESGKLDIVNSEYLFHSTVHDVISIMKMRMINPELRFAVYMQHDIPNELFGDEVRLRQIFLNILTNACKYTKKGFVTLDITAQWTGEESIEMTIKIKDTGLGIKKEDMEKLFKEFTQFDLEKNRNIEGSGLGLVITRNLINLMGGKIEVSSEYGKGSEFTIYLPQKLIMKKSAGNADALPPNFSDKSVLLYGQTAVYMAYTVRALRDLGVKHRIVYDDSELYDGLLEGTWDYVFAEEDLVSTAMHIVYSCELNTKVVLMSDSYTAKGGQDFATLIMPAYFLSIVNVLCGGDSGHFAKRQHVDFFIAPDAKLLLVDDINTNLKVGGGLLKPYGMAITLCLSGAEAIEAVKAVDYDLVFMDHMMPEMDGVEAVKHIRSLPDKKYASLPIVALTANAIVGAREMFLQNGFDDFLPKPIEIVKLNNILVKWIPKEKQKEAPPPGSVQEEQAPIIIEIENIDTARGIASAGGNARAYIDILKVFHKDAKRKKAEIINCLESNDLSLYAIYTHALKSACASIGAHKLSEEAKILEAAGMKHELDFIKEHNAGFLNRLKKLLADIEQVISDNAGEPGGDTLDTAALKKQLAKLKAALGNFDIAAIDEASLELQAFLQLPETDESLNSILQDAFVGKYKRAASQIDTLLEKYG